MSVAEAADQVLAGHLSVGEAARLTKRKKAEIGVAVEHAIYRRSRIGRDDGPRRRPRAWWRRWPVLLAASILAIEAVAALAVFHADIRRLIVAPAPPPVALPLPRRFDPPPPPPPPLPPPNRLLPAPAAAPEPARQSPAPPVRPSCTIKPEERAALAAICRSGAAFAPPECACLR